MLFKAERRYSFEKRWTTEDVANACLFFASDMSGYITGQVLNVDGGMLTKK
jgi:enoyl-[acyl-carrier-protein] reductase (NADH)